MYLENKLLEYFLRFFFLSVSSLTCVWAIPTRRWVTTLNLVSYIPHSSHRGYKRPEDQEDH